MPRFLLLILVASTTWGAELQADAAVDLRVFLSRNWDLLIHNRARVQAAESHWYDVSVIPILRYKARPNLQLYGGAFLTRYDFPAAGWRTVYRPVVGVEPSLRCGRVTLASRTGYERFLVTRGTDFNRYRERIRVSGSGPWAPYASVEAFFTSHGWATTRYGAGLHHDIDKHCGIEFFYWYEAREFAGAGTRHMLSTTLYFNLRTPDK